MLDFDKSKLLAIGKFVWIKFIKNNLIPEIVLNLWER